MPHQLTLEERDRIAHLRGRGANQKEIAAALDRAPSTISRELDRNRTGDEYYSAQAQQAAQRRRRERPLTRKMDDPTINELVRDGLTHEWSPEQITGRLEQQYPGESGRRVSAQTIYAWIEQDEDREHWQSFLRRRGKRPYRRKPAESADCARIADRPEIIEQRMRLGDFEGDTVLGPPGTGGLATLVDRKSRFTIVLKVQSKHADHVHQRLKDRLKELEAERRRSITFDNGTEFARCDRLEKHLGIKLYYADPGCPYQRGSNENTNRLLRFWLEKGSDLSQHSAADLRHIADTLNRRPRPTLDLQTPADRLAALLADQAAA